MLGYITDGVLCNIATFDQMIYTHAYQLKGGIIIYGDN